MTQAPLVFLLLGVALMAPACDYCEPMPDLPGNLTPANLEGCPALPPGVTPIAGLAVARATERFDGLVLTMSSRPLACGEPAAQHGYCHSDEERGLTLGLPAEQATPGIYALKSPIFMEFETPEWLSVGGGGDLKLASVEIFAVTDTCVTGQIVGLVAQDGPFDGGFQAPRCAP